MASETLQFDSPHFLQSLFANDQSLLKVLETAFHVKATTRDGWLKIDGSKPDIERATQVFERLESARRKGGDISAQTFRYTVDSVVEGWKDSIESFSDRRLLGSATKPPVMPRTSGQMHYLNCLRDNDVIFGIGPAGTGKTYLAMAHALQMLRDRKVDRIILTRPAVEAGEALGFLPGDLQEKIFPYLRPLYDAIYDMLEHDDAQRLIERNAIEIAPLAYMRGRTLNNACVILDEAQNTTCEQMFMFLTRLGDKSQCVVTGDPSQIDLRPRHRSGLLEAMDVLRQTPGISFCTFDQRDVVRHPVVQAIINAYDKFRLEKPVYEKKGRGRAGAED